MDGIKAGRGLNPSYTGKRSLGDFMSTHGYDLVSVLTLLILENGLWDDLTSPIRVNAAVLTLLILENGLWVI